MNLGEAITFMEKNPGVKITMPNHYRSWQYNYYDAKSKRFLTENGDVWDINLSTYYGELDGYGLFKEPDKNK